MSTGSAHEYAAARDRAIAAFVTDGDFSHIEAIGIKLPHNDVGAAAVYKAAQECRMIPEEVKARARAKCLALGYSPRIR